MSATGEAEGNNAFEMILGRYARREGDSIVIMLPASDLNNLGELVVQAIFGYLLNLQMRSGVAGDGAELSGVHAAHALAAAPAEARQ